MNWSSNGFTRHATAARQAGWTLLANNNETQHWLVSDLDIWNWRVNYFSRWKRSEFWHCFKIISPPNTWRENSQRTCCFFESELYWWFLRFAVLKLKEFSKIRLLAVHMPCRRCKSIAHVLCGPVESGVLIRGCWTGRIRTRIRGNSGADQKANSDPRTSDGDKQKMVNTWC